MPPFAVNVGDKSQSKTWAHEPMQFIDNGILYLTLAQLRFTAVRAQLEAGGYKCFMSLKCIVTPNGWSTAPPGIPIAMDVFNAASGLLLHWDVKDLLKVSCDTQRPFEYTAFADFEPDLYDIMWNLGLSYPATPMYKC